MEVPKLSRVLKWCVLIGLYLTVVGCCVGSLIYPFLIVGALSESRLVQFLSGLGGVVAVFIPLVLVGLFFSLVVWMYKRDKQHEKRPEDDFTGTNLLFRYGVRVNRAVLPIAVDPEWTEEGIQNFVEGLQQAVAVRIEESFSSSDVEVVLPVNITDRSLPSDSRDFLKIVYRSTRGSQLSHFIRYEKVGRVVVAHHFTFLRGRYEWHDVVDFVVTAPFHIWFWVFDWMRNQYSIVATLGRDVDNSYDQIDIETFFEASLFNILDETRRALEKEGLLTRDLERAISIHIDNSQRVNVTGSRGVVTGGIAQRIQDITRAFVGQAGGG